MAAAGIKACETEIAPHILQLEKTRRIINMAFDMKEKSSKLQFGNDTKIRLMIGIHVGRAIAAIIGHHKPQFSLIGDTVNTTSRVCFKGEQNVVKISEAAYSIVKGQRLYFKERKLEVN